MAVFDANKKFIVLSGNEVKSELIVENLIYFFCRLYQ